MKHFLSPLIACMAVPALMSADFPQGLSGNDLATAVREQYAPANVANTDNAPIWWGNDIAELAPSSWWATAPNDLINYVKASEAFVLAKSDFPPGEVVEALQSTGDWTVGIGYIGTAATNFWSPSADRRGDVARRYMYMALMYPQELWHGRGVMLYEDGSWPLLTSYGIDLLLGWHRADPVSDAELAEYASIQAAQGNQNPFVVVPQLAEYLWGDNAGQFTGAEASEPLKATYSKATDSKIYLYSPYVPADAAWQIDGTTVGGDYIATSAVAVGKHELSFTSSASIGSIIINVEP